MRILIYGLNFTPDLIGVGKYTGEMSAWLAEEGHEIRVITAPPYYPAWKVQSGYSYWRYSSEKVMGAQVYRCPLWVPGKPSGIKRLVHLISFAASSFPVLLLQAIWRPNIIFVVAPTLLCAPAGWVTSKITQAKSWLHVQDFEFDIALGLGIVKASIFHAIVLRIERFLLTRFDRVSTISERMLQRLKGKGVAESKCVLFPNWVDTRFIFPSGCGSSMREEYGIPSTAIVALYAGNIGEKQGLEIIMEAARQLKGKSQLFFVLAGEGAARARLVKMACGLENIIWLPLQPIEKLNELLNLGDIHLLPQRADAADLVMPSKLTGMLASGRPVIATAESDTQLGTIVSKFGRLVRCGDTEEFVAAIDDLANNPVLRHKLGASARKWVEENIDYRHIMVQLEREMVSLSNEP
jgi:colanic acid biosynthesis glycosyl transferase WcaI